MMKFMRRFGDLGMHGVSARWYDGNSRKHRLGEMRGYAKEVAEQISEGSSVLEVAPGPGYLSIELANEMKAKGIEALFMKLAFKYFRRRGAYNRDEMESLVLRTSLSDGDIKEGATTLSTYLKKGRLETSDPGN